MRAPINIEVKLEVSPGLTDDGADSEVTIDIGGGKTITAVVTREGADEAEATPDAQVLAIFKTSNVILASD